MFYYDRIDLSEEIDLTKRSSSKECMACHYSYYFVAGLNLKKFL